MSLLQKLQSKPKMMRQQIAFGGALALTAMIALVWAMALPHQFDSTTTTEVTSAQNEVDGSLSLFWKETKGRFGSLTANLEAAFTQSETATTTSSSTAAASATSTRQPAVIMPQLSSSTAPTLATSTARSTATPRVILIATTSSAQKSEDEE